MKPETFNAEQDSLISRMISTPAPDGRWPDGCYGCRLAWLTFVGPSPGGGDGKNAEVPRQEQVYAPLWNEEYTEPCSAWSIGFRMSTQVLVETVMGRKREQGALKLYNFANFDWMQNPNACNVPTDRMRRGRMAVLNHLAEVQPRVIIPMESKAHQLLSELLRQTYELHPLHFVQVEILIGGTRHGQRFHRHMDAYHLSGIGPLAGRYVIRCPQHPARIFNAEYAGRVGRALRVTLCAMADKQETVSIKEV